MKHVLVLDNERTICTTLEIILRQAGYQVSTFQNGVDALEHSTESTPDAALLDVNCPGLDGVDVAIQLASMTPQCKAILFTGSDEGHARVLEAAELGFHFPLWAKPTPPKELLCKLKAVLEGTAVAA